VNTLTLIFFVIAGGFAIGDWVAKARHDLRLEYVCKPATLAALVVAACTIDPAADAHTRRIWFVLALLASLKGDVLLMLDRPDRELFVAGLSAFLFAHLFYLAGFWSDGPELGAFLIAAVVVVAVVTPVAVRVLAGLRSEPKLRPPVAVYMVVISAMVATALATGNWLAGAGAVLFGTSDSMIAWNRFVRPFAAADVAIMVTYHLAQGLLVLSLLT
jgi:uncharacterized membrane protein YhhN